MSKEQTDKFADIEQGVPTPQLIIGDKVIVDAGAGVAHSIASTKDGKVFGWGWCNYG
jgi:alpha-tubulin suppressor-like RCC1 family protein